MAKWTLGESKKYPALCRILKRKCKELPGDESFDLWDATIWGCLDRMWAKSHLAKSPYIRFDEVEAAAGWEGPWDMFANALVDRVFLEVPIDGICEIHDWEDHVPESIKREFRRGNPAKSGNGRQNPAKSALPNRTEPNPTVPNLKLNGSTEPRSKEFQEYLTKLVVRACKIAGSHFNPWFRKYISVILQFEKHDSDLLDLLTKFEADAIERIRIAKGDSKIPLPDRTFLKQFCPILKKCGVKHWDSYPEKG